MASSLTPISNNVFGLTRATEEEVQALADSPGEFQMSRAKAGRLLDFDRKIIEDNRKTKAVTDPVGYINDRNADRNAIFAQAEEFLTTQFNKLIQQGYSSSAAETKAKTSAKAYLNELMKVHKDEYPEGTVNSIRQKAQIRL